MKAAKTFGLLLAALFLSWPNSVYAGLTYQFHQTSSSSSDFDLDIRFTIDNEHGVHASYQNGGPAYTDRFPQGHIGSLDNLIAFESNVPYLSLDILRWAATCPLTEAASDDVCGRYAFAFDINPTKVSLYFAYTDGDTFLQMGDFADEFYSVGEFTSEVGYASLTSEDFDAYALCQLPDPIHQGACFFEGEFVRVHVPEPGSLAIFAAGVMGFAALRRREWARMCCPGRSNFSVI